MVKKVLKCYTRLNNAEEKYVTCEEKEEKVVRKAKPRFDMYDILDEPDDVEKEKEKLKKAKKIAEKRILEQREEKKKAEAKKPRSKLSQVLGIQGVREQILGEKKKILKKELKWDPLGVPRLKKNGYTKVDIFTPTGKNPRTFYVKVGDLIEAYLYDRRRAQAMGLPDIREEVTKDIFLVKKKPDDENIIGFGRVIGGEYVSQFRWVGKSNNLKIAVPSRFEEPLILKNQPKNIQKYYNERGGEAKLGDFAFDGLIKFKKPKKIEDIKVLFDLRSGYDDDY